MNPNIDNALIITFNILVFKLFTLYIFITKLLKNIFITQTFYSYLYFQIALLYKDKKSN
jgi:hypothetical protein